MNDKKAKIISFILMILPAFFLFFFSAALIAYMHPASTSSLLLFLILIFLGSLLLHILIFKNVVFSLISKSESVQKTLRDQEQVARLLVRRDIELTKANEELHELDQRKSEFVSVAAHQLRTPLAGVKWALTMLVNGELGSLTEEQRTFVMKAHESNERMIHLVEDLLGTDKIDSGKYRFLFVPTDLLDLIENVLIEMHPQAQKRNIVINYQHNNVFLPKMNLDGGKIRGAMQNLLENAIKYSENGGTVTVRVDREDDGAKVSVSDSGIGIPEKQQKNIFNRFFRASNALKIQTDGTGLGLFIVKSIIEKHGGKIWFKSEENVGTTFFFTLKF